MWEIASDYRGLFATLELHSMAALRELVGASAAADRRVAYLRRLTLAPGTSDAVDVYYKEYRYKPASLSYLGRRSRARCEYVNYARLAVCGAAVADRIAWGEQRDRLGRLEWAFILTREVPDSETLVARFNGAWADSRDRTVANTRRAAMHALGQAVRRLHDSHFFHHDLVWRNLLVTGERDETAFCWIDCPRGTLERIPLRRRRKLLRDLASFDKSASRQCSRTERLRFLLAYLDLERLDPRAKRLAAATINYWRRRWPEDLPDAAP